MLYKFLRIKKTSQEFEEEHDDDTDSEYDNYGFNKYGIHKDTNLSYDLNNFYINGENRFTNNKYDINGFDEMVFRKILKLNMILMVLV